MDDGLRGALAKLGAFVAAVILLVLFIYGLFRALGSPVPISWIGRMLTGQFGVSRLEGQPILRLIVERGPATLELVVGSIVFALVIGCALGAIARGSRPPVARAIDALGLALASLPAFWFAVLVQGLIATHTSAVPLGGIASTDNFDPIDRLVHLALPALLLALVQISSVTTWFANRRSPNALAEMLARKLPTIFAVSAFIEIFFAWPGEGRLLFSTLLRGDWPILGILFVYATITIAARTATVADV